MRLIRLLPPAALVILTATGVLAALGLRWELNHLDEGARASGLAHLAIDLAVMAALLVAVRRLLSLPVFTFFAAAWVVLLALSPMGPVPAPWSSSRGWPEALALAGALAFAAAARRGLVPACAVAVALGIGALDPLPATALTVRTSAGDRPAADGQPSPTPSPGGSLALQADHATGFALGRVPSAEGQGGLAAWGNFSAVLAGHGLRGEFVSRPFSVSAALLQVRVLGELRPPKTALFLQTSSGRRILPLESAVSSAIRWHRLNFPAPTGRFQLIAQAGGDTPLALAFTEPVPISRAAWIAGKLLHGWPVLLTVSAALGLAALVLLATALPSAAAELAANPRARWLPWIALLGYLVFFARHTDSTAGPNDSGGYLNSARLLAHGSVAAAPRFPLPEAEARRFSPDLAAYTPGTFLPSRDGRLAPEYPVGFPLLVAIMGNLLPWSAAVPTLIVLQLAAGVLVTFALARAFALPPAWSFFAAAAIGLSPVYLFQGLQPQSDGPALVWVALAFVCVLRATAWPQQAERPVLAALGGGVASMAVLIRPSNALALLPLLLCFVRPLRWRPLLAFAAGGLPGAMFLLWYNHRLYGHALSTGYGDPQAVRTGFGLRYVWPTLHSYARWLPAFFTPVIWLAPLAPFLRVGPARHRLILGLWAAVFAAFYAVYWCTYDNWYNMRFLLPAAPALVILGVLAARALLARLRIPSLALGLGGAVALTFLGVRAADERVLYWMSANRVHAVAAQYAADHLPPAAVVFARPAAGTLLYYTPFPVVRSDSPAARDPAFYAALARAGHPAFALTYHWEQKGFRWGAGKGTGYPDLPGQWERMAVVGDDEMYLWRRRG